MDLLRLLIILSEKASNIARLCRQDELIFQNYLIQKKTKDEGNPRFYNDFKTVADVLIQQMIKYFIKKQFPQLEKYVNGEENNQFKNKFTKCSTTIDIKDSIDESIDSLKLILNNDDNTARQLINEVFKEINYDDINIIGRPMMNFELDLTNLSIWIDPIDATGEYISSVEKEGPFDLCCNGLRCATVLIGVYDKINGLPIMGIVNQPFFIQSSTTEWNGRCFWGITKPFKENSLPILKNPNLDRNIICVSNSEDKNLCDKLNKNGFNIVEISGAGFKIVNVIEGHCIAYILSKSSTFKWDTCGPQAILKSMNGDIINYEAALKNNIISITYEDGSSKENIGGIIAYRSPDILKKIFKTLVINN